MSLGFLDLKVAGVPQQRRVEVSGEATFRYKCHV